MINLLPDEHKQEIRAARTNVLLVRYIAILVCAGLVLGGLILSAYIALDGTKQAASEKVAENQQRASEFLNTKTQADTFRSDLSTAKAILDGSVSFSKLIYKIADAVPHNVVLDGLTLDPTTFGSSVTLTASAKTFGDATKLRDSFLKNDQIFSNVRLQSVKGSGASSSGDAYPVKVSLSVVINKGALQ